MNETVPVVKALHIGHKLIVDPCPFCGLTHFHGAAGGYGVKTAHCFRGSYTLTKEETVNWRSAFRGAEGGKVS